MRYYFPVPSQGVILKEYLKSLNMLYDIASSGAVYVKRLMKSVSCTKTG